MLIVVQRYITCEGRFNTSLLLHMRYLCHISGYKALNLPYFLHKDLLKMSKKIQLNPSAASHHIFHAGLIKILVKYELDKKNNSWDIFVKEVGFAQRTQKKKISIPIKSLRSVPRGQSPPTQETVTKQQGSLDPSSSNISKKKVPFPRKEEALKGPIPSSLGIKELSQIYKRRKTFPSKETSVTKEVETPVTCEDALPQAQNTEAAMKSQVQKDKGKKKMNECTEHRIAVEGQHIVMTRKRRKLILPDTSPSSEIDTKSKKPVTKAIPKASKLKTHTRKELKDKALRKGKAVEPLQEESLEILSSEYHQTQETYVQPDQSTDTGYDEADTFRPAST